MVMETEGVKERGEGAGFEMALCPVARDGVARDKHHGGGVVMLLLMPNYHFLLRSGVKPVLSSARGGGTSTAVAAFFETFFPLSDENAHDKKRGHPVDQDHCRLPLTKTSSHPRRLQVFPRRKRQPEPAGVSTQQRLGLAATHGRIED